MPNKINFYGNDHIWFTKNFNLPDKNLNIGVINWWWIDRLDTLDSIERFIDSNDICFFLSEEIIYRFSHITTNDLFSLLNRKNVFNIFTSEEYGLAVQPIAERSYYFPWFFKTYITDSQDFKIELDYKPKNYDFNLLLGSNKAYRTILFKLLKDNPKVYSTYFGSPKYKSLSNISLEETECLDTINNQPIESEKLNTLLMIGNSDNCVANTMPRNIYNNTHFDIVTETFIKNNHQFITEKTAKPLSTGRYFCWYASPNFKDYLTRYGFSFESYYGNYDSVIDDMTRLVTLVNDIDEISSNEKLVKHIYETTKDERVHNQLKYREQTKSFLKNLEQWVVGKIENA